MPGTTRRSLSLPKGRNHTVPEPMQGRNHTNPEPMQGRNYTVPEPVEGTQRGSRRFDKLSDRMARPEERNSGDPALTLPMPLRNSGE